MSKLVYYELNVWFKSVCALELQGYIVIASSDFWLIRNNHVCNSPMLCGGLGLVNNKYKALLKGKTGDSLYEPDTFWCFKLRDRDHKVF